MSVELNMRLSVREANIIIAVLEGAMTEINRMPNSNWALRKDEDEIESAIIKVGRAIYRAKRNCGDIEIDGQS